MRNPQSSIGNHLGPYIAVEAESSGSLKGSGLRVQGLGFRGVKGLGFRWLQPSHSTPEALLNSEPEARKPQNLLRPLANDWGRLQVFEFKIEIHWP